MPNTKYKIQNPSLLYMLRTALFVLILFALCPLSFAEANSFDLSISPQIFQIELSPPATARASKTITLENSGDDALPLLVQYRFFKPQGVDGEIEYLKDDVKPGNDPQILDRIVLLESNQEVKSLTIPPKSKKQLDLAVNIPKDEPPGDYYFSIIFLSVNPEASKSAESSQSSAIGGIAMNVLLSIGPKTKTTGSIEEFSTPFFEYKGPVNFNVKIRNSSSHFIYPKGQILITNMFGQKIGKIDLLPLNILSGSSRMLPSREQFVYAAQIEECKTKKTDKCKEYEKKNPKLYELGTAPSAIWPENFLLGPYKATLTIALSDEGPLYVKSIHFVGLPVTVILAFLICITLIIAIRARLEHRFHLKK